MTSFESAPGRAAASEASLGDGVALVRRVLGDTTTQPRWPMYPRQFKQFLRNAQPDFDERRYGSIADLMRACQKDGLLRLERDRQGALRVFASGGAARPSVPHGWGAHRENGAEATQEAPSAEAGAPILDVTPEAVVDPEPQTIVDAQITHVVDDAAPKAKRASRARKTAGAEKKKPAARKKKAQ